MTHSRHTDAFTVSHPRTPTCYLLRSNNTYAALRLQRGGAVATEDRRGRTHAFTVVAGAFRRRPTAGCWHGSGAGRGAPPGVGPRAQRAARLPVRLRQALRQVRGCRLPIRPVPRRRP